MNLSIVSKKRSYMMVPAAGFYTNPELARTRFV